MTTNQNKGFTLLEILLVIAAIGILAAIVLVAINPNRQIAQARNTVRQADINTIQKAVEQYLIEKGSYPSSISTTPGYICNTGTEQVGGNTSCSGRVDLRELVPDYIAGIPKDPQATGTSTGYIVAINPDNNKISVSAGLAEGKAIVSNIFTVQDGLVLHLDAGNPASYPGSGTTWFDLSGNNNNGVLLNGVGFDSANGGSLVFDGVDDYVNLTSNLGNPQQFSVSFLGYPTALNINSNNNYRRIFIASGVSDNVILIEQGGNISFRVPGGSGTNFQSSGFSGINQWGYVTCVYNQTHRQIYFNGVFMSQFLESGVTVNFGSPQIISPNNIQTFQGNISNFKIYNRSLTPEEIAQNFNATRDRFGL
jgi:prepilin-type N-terminal cleavage/methylation domain-containing protein